MSIVAESAAGREPWASEFADLVNTKIDVEKIRGEQKICPPRCARRVAGACLN
jgi:hypothetical protein